MSSFEDALRTMEFPADFRQALIDVGDTAWMCRKIFDDLHIEPSGDALVAMIRLVLERELVVIRERRK